MLATGWLIGTLEAIHDPRDCPVDEYYKQWVLLYGKLCTTMYQQLFSTHARQGGNAAARPPANDHNAPPKKAFVAYGPFTTDPSGFVSPSFSTSLPGANMRDTGGINMRTTMQKIRADAFFRVVPAAELAIQGANTTFPAGNCAEWIPFAA